MNPRLFESLRLRSCIGIEDCILYIPAARPKAHAAHFVGVRFSRHRVRAWPFRGATAGKPRDRKVEAPPEKVYRAALANESRPELPKDRIRRQQDAPEFLNRCTIIRRVYAIFVERNRICDL